MVRITLDKQSNSELCLEAIHCRTRGQAILDLILCNGKASVNSLVENPQGKNGHSLEEFQIQ